MWVCVCLHVCAYGWAGRSREKRESTSSPRWGKSKFFTTPSPQSSSALKAKIFHWTHSNTDPKILKTKIKPISISWLHQDKALSSFGCCLWEKLFVSTKSHLCGEHCNPDRPTVRSPLTADCMSSWGPCLIWDQMGQSGIFLAKTSYISKLIKCQIPDTKMNRWNEWWDESRFPWGHSFLLLY